MSDLLEIFLEWIADPLLDYFFIFRRKGRRKFARSCAYKALTIACITAAVVLWKAALTIPAIAFFLGFVWFLVLDIRLIDSCIEENNA